MKKYTTLAQLISTKREELGYSQKGLSDKANIDLPIIENIESGQELFLSPSVRQKIALALKLSPQEIKFFEKQPQINEKDFEIVDKAEELKIKILNEDLKGHKCPVCGAELVCRVAIMYDLEDNLIRHPKARCSKCPFLIK